MDIWSVGVILYTLYFGIPPFETEDANSTYQRIKDCSYFIPKTVNTPPEAINLINKILVRNPADRPTLEEILSSDFMRLGHGIPKELPLVCSKKAPTKKELNMTQSIQKTELGVGPCLMVGSRGFLSTGVTMNKPVMCCGSRKKCGIC